MCGVSKAAHNTRYRFCEVNTHNRLSSGEGGMVSVPLGCSCVCPCRWRNLEHEVRRVDARQSPTKPLGMEGGTLVQHLELSSSMRVRVSRQST